MTDPYILLVDDDRAVNFLSKVILADSNIQGKIDVALNGKQALEIVDATDRYPNVIFLDVNMPEMNGFEFLDGLKQRPNVYNNTQVYVLTSSLRDSDRETALGHTCVKAYLEKPLTTQMVERVFGL